MKILNFGSINIDYVYGVSHFVKPSETIASDTFEVFMGGKGCNQSVALAKAGAEVFHAGNIGSDGAWIQNQLQDWGVATQFLNQTAGATGHAIIQVTPEGQNAIIIHGGANRVVTIEQISETLQHFEENDILLLQNEVNLIPEMIEAASTKGMKIFFNPAPMTPNVQSFPLDKIDVFIINEIEGQELTGAMLPEEILTKMNTRFLNAAILLTLGEKGAIYAHQNARFEVKAKKVKAIDTTAAGDTFIGYFLASWVQKRTIEACLETSTKAAALCVTRKGGAISIPEKAEIG